MLTLGPVSFIQPWLLLGLASLPILYWLIRATPPAPRTVRFPALRLLHGLRPEEETPARTPWWLLLLRLLLAALIIIACAGPVINPTAGLPGSGPVLLLVDNGWAAGRDWSARQTILAQAIDAAERADRPLRVAASAADGPGPPPSVSGLMRPADARGWAEQLAPRPWTGNRNALLDSIESLDTSSGIETLWLSDGLDDADAMQLAETLRRIGPLTVFTPDEAELPWLIHPPETEGSDLYFLVERIASSLGGSGILRVVGDDGRILARRPFSMAPEAGEEDVRVALPAEARNRVFQAIIEDIEGVGSVALIDERWRRRPVAIVGEAPEDSSQPLLSESYYLDRALAPFAEIWYGDLDELLERRPAVVVLPDSGQITDEQAENLDGFIDGGGVVVRFAGPLFAANPDRYVPVPLRAGDRTLSGALSWTTPQPLAPFPVDSPFNGLSLPEDVLIERQVLAQPGPLVNARTWARLADGTPLVTAEQRTGADGAAAGWLILVHTTAGPDWSNLPLSGLFVDMLRRIVALSAGVAEDTQSVALRPISVLDGFGRLNDAGGTAMPIGAGDFADTLAAPGHPPGVYGAGESRRALNLAPSVMPLAPLQIPSGIPTRGYDTGSEFVLFPFLLAAAMALAVIDLLASLAIRGLLPSLRSKRAATASLTALIALASALATPDSARAQPQSLPSETLALLAANGTYLAYVVTGDPSVDAISQAGLDGLSRVLTQRTAVEPDGALGVDLERDELAFFSLLYWPITETQPTPSSRAFDRLNEFLAHGGTILFDTRDAGFAGANEADLRRLTAGLDIPPLSPVDPDHVLTRAFYLLQVFPGRYADDELWVMDADETVNDGVSSVIIGANDWASAWAMDSAGNPQFTTVPGGEWQREIAFRFGINLVMYVLTGNYKADQVHVPAILERLGQ
ncbi:MAG: DUF4159 domain-containing protein [Pseudomonadota bacterium]